ncbi:MAG TPA: imidazole glycerol phosphate synthase subunit HisH [bacterium]|nr:imidazole glycerol phosphate synthase subunit HisH [bacterium]
MIAIIDYGAGNLRSVHKALEHLGTEARVSSSSAEIIMADKLILPGVGAFGKALEAIDGLGLREAICDFVASGRPFLGICLGMQLLFETSEESPGAAGLGLLPGRVRRFGPGLKVPHLGWNALEQRQPSPLWKGIPPGSYFYFAHSYFVEPAEPEVIAGVTGYGGPVPAAIGSGMIHAVQFHPEKSQQHGLQLLRNFITL